MSKPSMIFDATINGLVESVNPEIQGVTDLDSAVTSLALRMMPLHKDVGTTATLSGYARMLRWYRDERPTYYAIYTRERPYDFKRGQVMAVIGRMRQLVESETFAVVAADTEVLRNELEAWSLHLGHFYHVASYKQALREMVKNLEFTTRFINERRIHALRILALHFYLDENDETGGDWAVRPQFWKVFYTKLLDMWETIVKDYDKPFITL